MARSKGSTEHRGNNRWRLEFVESGKKYRKTITAKGEREARKELAKFIAEVESKGYHKPQNITLGDFIEEWKKYHAPTLLSPLTLERYVDIINLRILPKFGQKKLNQITARELTQFLNALKEDGARADGKNGRLNPSTVNYHRRVLKNIFDYAVDQKLVTDNPVLSYRKESESLTAGNVYSQAEIEALYMALEKEDLKWRLYFLMAITCGLRREELLGLEWKNIDLDGRTLSIDQVAVYTKENGYIFKEPKSKSSERSFKIPLSIYPLLVKYKENRAKERERLIKDGNWEGGDRFLVFSTYNGKPHYHTYPRTKWKRIVGRNENLRYIRPHDLRHSCATHMLNIKVPINEVSSKLGHARASTTLNIYGHNTPETSEESAQAFDFLIPLKSAKRPF